MLRKLISPVSVFLFLILSLGFFLRIYGINNTLGFYYDQGRDALIVWNLWHGRDFFLIGPTTGIEGIFRGPFYYYLITPFYILGKGNPVWPSVFLSLTTIAASFLAYYLGKKIHSTSSGIIAAIFTSLSFNIVMASRWLSNPTPMLLLSMLLVLFMIQVTEKKRWGWAGIAVVLGLSLFHFGSSGEAFYFPAVAIFAFWQRKNLPDRKIFFTSVLLFFVTVLPLIIFEIRNNFLITENVRKFFIEDRSFREITWKIAQDKINFYWDTLTKLVFHGRSEREKFLLAGAFFFIVFYLHRLIKLTGVKILLLLLGSMMIGLVFFQGNQGNFYEYYLTGYFLIFILFFSIGMAEIWKRNWGKIFILYFIYVFLYNNFYPLRFKLTDQVNSPGSIALKNELQAVDWVYKDADGEEFNVDVYVPPVIPYAYDYLFKWRGSSVYRYEPSEENLPLLYTVYEQDPPNPDRLELWLARQGEIGQSEKLEKFGAITVERRLRIQ